MAPAEHDAVRPREHVKIIGAVEIAVVDVGLREEEGQLPLTGTSSESSNSALEPSPVQFTTRGSASPPSSARSANDFTSIVPPRRRKPRQAEEEDVGLGNHGREARRILRREGVFPRPVNGERIELGVTAKSGGCSGGSSPIMKKVNQWTP